MTDIKETHTHAHHYTYIYAHYTSIQKSPFLYSESKINCLITLITPKTLFRLSLVNNNYCSKNVDKKLFVRSKKFKNV